MPPGDMLVTLAGKLTPVRQHVAAEQAHADALKSPALLAQRQNHSFLLRKGHMPTATNPGGGA
jgi:hypothetical protein